MSRSMRKLSPDPPATPKHYNQKDRKRWCKGRPGIEHVVAVLDIYDGSLYRRSFTASQIEALRQIDANPLREREWRPARMLIRECTVCGRVLGYANAEPGRAIEKGAL